VVKPVTTGPLRATIRLELALSGQP